MDIAQYGCMVLTMRQTNAFCDTGLLVFSRGRVLESAVRHGNHFWNWCGFHKGQSLSEDSAGRLDGQRNSPMLYIA